MSGKSDLIGEHSVAVVIAGTVESARQRLIIALEHLGYRIISENPLRARHGAQAWAHAYLSAIALEYPTNLEIGLRPQGHGATQVTFDYQVQHSGTFTEGDCQTLTREAEAIAALALRQALQMICAGCGAAVSAEARFCRKCGAPIKSQMPAELEVLRLTAGARAGYQWTVFALLLFLLAGIFPLITLLTNKAGNKLLFIAAIISAFGAWALAAGLRRLHLTLNPQPEKDDPRSAVYQRLPAAPITNELPPAAVVCSVTEGTTALLPALSAEPVSVPPRPERDSG